MEPMTLGSPNGPPSPATNNPYLPAFLMGESVIVHTPRNNTLSPTKGRTLAFGKKFNFFFLEFILIKKNYFSSITWSNITRFQ